MERTQDIQRHRMMMIAEREQKERNEQEDSRDLLKQKRTHDIKVVTYTVSNVLMYYIVCIVSSSTAREGKTSLPGSHRTAAVSTKSSC